MASPRSYPYGLCTIVVILIFSSTFLPFIPVGLVFSKSSETSHKPRKPVLCSRPPQCINKCLSCNPCKATLVIPPHRSKCTVQAKEEKEETYYPLSWKCRYGEEKEETYYPLSWKCRCGDKLFQP